MKNKLGCISLIIVLISILTRCSSCSYSKPDTTDHRKNIYTVKVTKISSDDYGDFMVKGETDAPNGSKILAQGESDKSENVASSINEDDYPQVKKHKFTAELDANDLTDDVSKGQKIKVKIFAVRKYHIDYDDLKISKRIQKLIVKQVEPVILTVNSKIADYLKDDDDDSDNNNSATDTDDSSDTDDSDDGDEIDDPESDSDDSAINDEEDSDDTNSNEDTVDDEIDDNEDDDTDSTSSRSTAGMVYTRDSDKITADKATGKYHLPSQAGYYIKKENVETFNSEKDAIAAGYVKSKR